MNWPHQIPLWLKIALISVLIVSALHCGFVMVDQGNSPFALIELIAVTAFAIAIGPIIVGPPPAE